MFEREIQKKCMVDLYDTHLNKLTSGKITAYKEKPGYIVIDHAIYYPVHCIAKITVRAPYNMNLEQTAQV
jgi:hypothetical protein